MVQMQKYVVEDYARAGAKATDTIEYPQGPLEGPHGLIPHTLEPTLRKNGMPTKLNKGVVELVGSHIICKEGQRLSPEQVVLLRQFDIKMSTFKVFLDSKWTEENGFEQLLDDDYLEDGEDDIDPFDDGVPMLPPGV